MQDKLGCKSLPQNHVVMNYTKSRIVFSRSTADAPIENLFML